MSLTRVKIIEQIIKVNNIPIMTDFVSVSIHFLVTINLLSEGRVRAIVGSQCTIFTLRR